MFNKKENSIVKERARRFAGDDSQRQGALKVQAPCTRKVHAVTPCSRTRTLFYAGSFPPHGCIDSLPVLFKIAVHFSTLPPLDNVSKPTP